MLTTQMTIVVIIIIFFILGLIKLLIFISNGFKTDGELRSENLNTLLSNQSTLDDFKNEFGLPSSISYYYDSMLYQWNSIDDHYHFAILFNNKYELIKITFRHGI